MRRNDGFDEWNDELEQEFREQLEVAREVFQSDRTPAEKAVWLGLMAEKGNSLVSNPYCATPRKRV
jgi:hypothetical protein